MAENDGKFATWNKLHIKLKMKIIMYDLFLIFLY